MEEQELSNYDVVYFSTSTCGPCKISKPLVEKASTEYNINTKFFIVDTEPNGRDIASKFNVRSVPTTIFFKDNLEVSRKVGLIKEEEFLMLHNNLLF